MTRKFIRFALTICVSMAIHGCQTHAGKGLTEQEALLSVRNLVGEECHLQELDTKEHMDLTQREFEVFCGRWENPSGHVYSVSSTEGALETWTKAGWWHSTLERRLQCGSGEASTILDRNEALIVDCKLRNGGWPYLALAAEVNGVTYLADGIPAVLPVLVQAIGTISGTLSTKGEPGHLKSSAVQKLEAKLSGQIYGAGDLRTYFRLMSAGQFYNSIKEFITAANRYREALAIHERILGIENTETLDPLMHLALELSNQKRFTEAQALFNRADVLATQTIDQSDRARYLSYRALHAANQHLFADALKYSKQATALRRELNSQNPVLGDDRIGGAIGGSEVASRASVTVIGNVTAPTTVDLVQSLYLEAAMLQRLGDIRKAQEVTMEASDILQTADEAPSSWAPELLGLNANIAKALGVGVEHEQNLNAAASLWDEVAPGERPGAVTYLKLGLAYRERGRFQDAMVAFRRGIRLLKSRGGGLAVEQIMPFMQTAFEIAQSDPNQRSALYREMFEASQLVRGGQTSQDIARAAARLAASENRAGDAVRDLQELQDERYFLYRAFEAEIASGGGTADDDQKQQLTKLRKKIASVTQQIQETSGKVQAAYPGYNQLVDAFVDADRVATLVRPREALLHIMLGELQSFVFIVRQNVVNAFPLRISATKVAKAVQELRAGLQPIANRALPRFNVDLAHELYLDLFGSLSKEFDGIDHIITVPSGSLLSFPFGLLVTEPPPSINANDYTGVKWLAERSAISLLPSVRSFVDLRLTAKQSTARKAFIGFGNFVPFTANSLSRVDKSLPKECLQDARRLKNHRELLLALGSLPISEMEVESVAKTFPATQSQTVFRSQFNETTVLNEPLRDYRIVYFATHGILPSELECEPEPSLVTSLSQPPHGEEDGLLEASDILRLKLDADLVVLSACNTGGPGLETGGESLSGLARAFFFAGARTLLVSHWLAENETTAGLMTRMFDHIRKTPQMSLSSALRLAQLESIQAAAKSGRLLLSHPLLWGAFTIVGDGAKQIIDM